MLKAEPEIDGAVAVSQACESIGAIRAAIDLLLAVEELVFVRGYWDLRLDIGRRGYTLAIEIDDRAAVAHFHTISAGVQLLRRNYDAAANELASAEQYARAADDLRQLDRWRRTLALLQERTGDAEGAQDGVDLAEQWSSAASDAINVIDCVWLRGQLLLDANAPATTLEQNYRYMIGLTDAAGWRRAEGFAMARLAAILLTEHKVSDALVHVKQAYVVAKEFSDPRLLVTCMLVEAAITRARGRRRRARKLQREAWASARELGIPADDITGLQFTDTG
jgi:hypothetical protein